MNFIGPGGFLSPQLSGAPQLSAGLPPQYSGLPSPGMAPPIYGGLLAPQPQSGAPMGLMATATQGMPSTAQSMQGIQGLLNPNTNWSQIAYQMAGSPKQGGMYPSVAVPAGTAGATGTGGFANSAAGGITLGLLGALAKNPSALNSIIGLLGGTQILSPGAGAELAAEEQGSGGGADPSAQQTWNGDSSGDPGSDDGFSSAGGVAATLPDGITPAVTDSSIQAGLSSPDALSSSNTSLGGLLSDAGNALGVVQGLEKGGVSGDASAVINAGNLANKVGAFGADSSLAGGALGAAGGALGLYNGLEQGGAAGDINAGLGAANLASSVGSLAGGTAAGGLGSLASIGAFAGPLSIALAPALMGLASSPYTLTPTYWNNFNNSVAAGPSGNLQNNTNYLGALRELQNNPSMASPAEWQQLAQYGITQQNLNQMIQQASNLQPALVGLMGGGGGGKDL